MNVWGIDISNWNGQTTLQNIADWKNAGVQVCMIRASLESQRLYDISVQQFNATKNQIQTTLPYAWCYGSDAPESVVEATVKMVDGLASEKKIVFDVEDIVNFISHFKTGGITSQSVITLPNRYIATIEAMKEATDKFGPSGKFHFSALSQASAVSWLARAFDETRKLEYEPCIYSANWCWVPITGNSAHFSEEKWLVAQFDNNPDLSIFVPVGGIHRLMGKQYTDRGQIPFNDQNAPQYDFSVYDSSLLITSPSPTPTNEGPDVFSAFARAKRARQLISSIDEEIKYLEEDLSYPGGPS